MNPTETTPSADAPLPLAAVLITERLAERTARPADPVAENRALQAVARAIGTSARAALDALMDEALALCCPDGNATTGVSLLERDAVAGTTLFRWTAMAGRLASHTGGSTPRDFSPCGVCLDQVRPVLFARPDLRFTYFLSTGVPFVEGLVLPFQVDGEPAGTIWIVTHDDSRRLDAEDVRVMTSLAEFTGAVYTLLRAREAADRAREEREQLLQTVSHEWRTPLGAITGMTTLVEQGVAGPVTAEQRELLQRARAAADHLLAMANDTLAGASPGARESRGVLHVERVELQQLVRDTTAMVQPAARSAALGFTADLGPEPVFVHADPTRLRQILLNLLANAIKYTPRGGVHVRLQAPDAGQVRVTVRDTGVGLTPEQAARVFERHWRADGPAHAPEARTRDGAGLGLSISRGYARAMGGELTVESAARSWLDLRAHPSGRRAARGTASVGRSAIGAGRSAFSLVQVAGSLSGPDHPPGAHRDLLHLLLPLARPARQPHGVGGQRAAAHGAERNDTADHAGVAGDQSHHHEHHRHEQRGEPEPVECQAVGVHGLHAQTVTGVRPLDRGTEISVAPLPQSGILLHPARCLERLPEIAEQPLPFAVRGSARQRDDAPDARRHAEHGPTRQRAAAHLQRGRRLGDPHRIEASFHPDLLQLHQCQPVARTGRAPRRRLRGGRQLEDLPDVVVGVAFRVVHGSPIRGSRAGGGTVPRAWRPGMRRTRAPPTPASMRPDRRARTRPCSYGGSACRSPRSPGWC